MTASLAMLSAIPSTVRAQAVSGDNLDWIGGTANTSWTAPGNLWDDISQLGTGGGTPVSLSAASGNQGLTYGLFFIGGGNPTFGTVAPTTLNVTTNADKSGQLFGVNYLSFTSDFNPTTTMTLASGRTDGLATSLNFVSGWTINDRATSGTVTFNTSSTNNYGLYFTINGAGSITPNAGSSVVLNLNVADGTTAGSIGKSDNGTLTLGGSNTYSGGTTVSGGTLIVTGGSSVTSGTGSGAVTVSSGATLAGKGVVGGTTTINSGAVLSPGTGGNTIAVLQVGSGSQTSGLTLHGDFRLDLDGTGTVAGVNDDLISVRGLLTLDPTSSHLVIGSVGNQSLLHVGQQYFIALNDGTDPVVGSFAGLLQGGTLTDGSGDTYTINYLANGDGGTIGNDISLTVTGVALVPEPSTWALLVGAGVGLLAMRRRLRGNTI